MTLLVSQVEALKGNMPFPFIHEFEGSLHYGELAKQSLVENETAHISDIYVQEGKAVEKVTITFCTESDIISFLSFEKRFVLAGLLHEQSADLPKRKLFHKKRKQATPLPNYSERLGKSYTDTISLLRIHAARKIQETVTL